MGEKNLGEGSGGLVDDATNLFAGTVLNKHRPSPSEEEGSGPKGASMGFQHLEAMERYGDAVVEASHKPFPSEEEQGTEAIRDSLEAPEIVVEPPPVQPPVSPVYLRRQGYIAAAQQVSGMIEYLEVDQPPSKLRFDALGHAKPLYRCLLGLAAE